jgi:hypothetical protein
MELDRELMHRRESLRTLTQQNVDLTTFDVELEEIDPISSEPLKKLAQCDDIHQPLFDEILACHEIGTKR